MSGVQWMHRVLGTLLVAAAVVLLVGVRRMKMDRATTAWCAALVTSIAAQYALGVLTLLMRVPIPLAVAHQATAMVIVAAWIGALHHVRHLDSGEK